MSLAHSEQLCALYRNAVLQERQLNSVIMQYLTRLFPLHCAQIRMRRKSLNSESIRICSQKSRSDREYFSYSSTIRTVPCIHKQNFCGGRKWNFCVIPVDHTRWWRIVRQETFSDCFPKYTRLIYWDSLRKKKKKKNPRTATIAQA